MPNRRRPSPLSSAIEIVWSDEITEVLITQRRRHQAQFNEQSRHDDLWTRIANHLRNNYQFEVTTKQCQTKFYALIRGYENLKRLHSSDPDADGVEIRSPSRHDRMFYENLSDEFWTCGGDYLKMIVTIEYSLIIYFTIDRYQDVYRRYTRQRRDRNRRAQNRSRSRSRTRHRDDSNDRSREQSLLRILNNYINNRSRSSRSRSRSRYRY